MARMDQIGKTATTLKITDNGLIVQYHETEVVKIEGNRITLNNGGYRTATTKTRMNQASNQFDLGYQVYQQNKRWFVRLASGNLREYDNEIITFDKNE